MQIDLNADLGEGGKYDKELLTLVTSANIACGFHAGDADLMRQSVMWAKQNNVAIGAHPAFPDRENFGRTAMNLPATTVYNQVIYQLGALNAIAVSQHAKMVHVKPHGMLYNQAAKDSALATVIAQAIKDVDPTLCLVGLANSALTQAGEDHGLIVAHEVFADRHYQDDGTLVPRSHPLALIETSEEAIEQTLEMVINHRVRTLSGQWRQVMADTVCLHGDSEHALQFAKQLRKALQQENIQLRSFDSHHKRIKQENLI
ncbi:5-oxoprolinase subunit PxpA [Orbaceae bacterium ESL0727]|nr:5-oxoprolinase subunit PxpA [Orbaceae bacterium ESL0727]